MGYLQRRRARRLAAVEKAQLGLAHPPLIEQVPRDANEFSMSELFELRTSIVIARRLVSRRSPVGTLLADAYTWLDAWLNEWQSGDIQTPYLFVLYRQMVERLTRIAERMSIVAECDARRWQGHGRNDNPSALRRAGDEGSA